MTTLNVHSDTSTESGRFTSVIRSELCALEYQGDSRALSYPSSLSGVQTGHVDVLNYRGLGEQWGGRDRRLVRADRADYYVVCAPLFAQLAVHQNGNFAELHKGRFAIVSMSKPFHARIRSEAEGEWFSAIHARIPGSLLRRRIPNIDDVCGREIPVTPGSSRLMVSLFELALSEAAHLSDVQKLRFGNELFDVVIDAATTVADSSSLNDMRPSAHERTLACAKAFIDANLSDPELDPGKVALHCKVSTRFLHASFALGADDSVANLIRESRLLASREALRNPALQRRTIIEIAGDWGFDDPAYFCRVYKARFGRTPREDRHLDPGGSRPIDIDQRIHH